MNFYEPERMYLERFNEVLIFRPRLTTELELRAQAEAHLRASFAVKRYESRDEINSILQHQFSFYTNLLEELLPSVSSLHFLRFVLYQFDLYARIDRLHKDGALSDPEVARWMVIEASLRRAAKYIAERIILLSPDEAPTGEERLRLSTTEKIWICAEQMVDLYMKSDLTFSTFPDHTALEILPPGEELYLAHEITKDCPDIKKRAKLDIWNRRRFVPEPSFMENIEEHSRIIGTVIRDVVGLSYREALSVLAHIIKAAESAPGAFQVPLIHKARTIKSIADLLEFPPEAVERVINGFSMSKEQMESEDRDVWKPKREYRAYRRAFFELPRPSGQLLIFSRAMAQECFVILERETVFGHLPKEWRSAEVDRFLGRLSLSAGAWFEKVVEENFKAINYLGRSVKNGIGVGDKRIPIPPDVGEIDFIGYSTSERTLLIAECKFVSYSFEPKYHRDDIDEFVTSKNSYVSKFRRKVQWVRDNFPLVSQAISSTYGADVSPVQIAAVIVTYYPTMATCLIEDFPCVSITELMLDYESTAQWSYEIGVFPAP